MSTTIVCERERERRERDREHTSIMPTNIAVVQTMMTLSLRLYQTQIPVPVPAIRPPNTTVMSSTAPEQSYATSASTPVDWNNSHASLADRLKLLPCTAIYIHKINNNSKNGAFCKNEKMRKSTANVFIFFQSTKNILRIFLYLFEAVKGEMRDILGIYLLQGNNRSKI